MATRLVHVVIDAADPLSQGAFWSQALGWSFHLDRENFREVIVSPEGFKYPGNAALPLVFVPVPEPKTTKNRVHIDLASMSPDDQVIQVERLLELGATRVDIGQGDVPWEVLVDPEGNEFCVLDPRDIYRDTGPVAAIVVDVADRDAMAAFWSLAAGWPITGSDEDSVSLRSPTGEGPYLEMLASDDPRRVKNRMHLDVAPFLSTRVGPEVSRLRDAGAKPADVGQGDEPWVVLADPDGQEFCVLSPR